jgi:ABC-type sugar transport system substrate-binding protein
MQADANLGRRMRDFVVEERIGRGGMATVYRARQLSVNRDVALKVIPIEPTSPGETNEFRQRFEQEANLIAGLEHLHILPIYDYGVVDGDSAFLAMRLLRGGTLADLLKRGPLDFDQAADIFTQIARGLGYAHSRQVIHRDLKPSNIMMDESGNAYLTDFGLAKLLKDSREITRTGSIVGTPVYMSPEQLRGEPLDTRSDIYSLGVLLYHMVAGHPPFDSADYNMVSVIYQHLETAAPAPSKVNPAVPPALDAVILRALQKRRDDRFATAEDMANAVADALGRSTKISTASLRVPRPEALAAAGANLPTTTYVRAAQAPSSRTELVARLRSRPVLGSLIAVAGIMAALALLVMATRPPGEPEAPTGPLVLAGQVGSAASSTPTEEEIRAAARRMGDDGLLAYIACTQDTDYHATQAREIGDLARSYGLEYRVYDGSTDPYRQITLIERARTEGARALIICPLNPEVLSTALRSVEEARIPTVYMAATMPEDYGGVLLAGDDYQMGFAAGEAGGEIIRDMLDGSARVVVLNYPTFPTLVNRANGLVDGMLSVAPDAEVVATVTGATRELGRESVAGLIEQGIAFDVILSINDAGSYGAIEAMEAAGIPPEDVYISSVDAEPLARQYIRDDYYIRASLEVNRRDFSIVATHAIVKMLAGTQVPETYLVPPGSVVTRSTLEGTGSQSSGSPFLLAALT